VGRYWAGPGVRAGREREKGEGCEGEIDGKKG
jgi:hypothetical protein